MGIEPLKTHPSGEAICPKGQASPALVYHPNRLTQPMRRTSPKGVNPVTWAPISWDEALDEITQKMASIRDNFGSEQVAFAVTTPSGTQISDGIKWIERLIRVFGSPNTIYSTEICNWHKDFASRFTYGFDIGTPDLTQTDCVLLWGNNPASTWLSRSIEVMKARKRGAKLIVVDPRPTAYARLADCWLRIKPGTDQALALGLAQVLIENHYFDSIFLKEWTNGPFLIRSDNKKFLRESDIQKNGNPNIVFASQKNKHDLLEYNMEIGRWCDDPRDTVLDSECIAETLFGNIKCYSSFHYFKRAAFEFSLDEIAGITGVDVETIQRAAYILSDTKSCSYYAWNGIAQSPIASQTDRAISILYTLTGNYGRKGGNVPGTAAPIMDISGHDLISKTQKNKALGLAKRPIGPGLLGWVTARDVYKAITKQKPYPIRMLFSFGSNLLTAQPDTKFAMEALKNIEYYVHADFFINPSAEFADIVLPVATSWEREGLCTGFDANLEGLRLFQLREAAIPPLGQSRGDLDIVLALAERLGYSKHFFQCQRELGYNHILSKTGLSVELLKAKPEGIQVKSKVPYEPYAQVLDSGLQLGFPTLTKKIEIYSELLLTNNYDPIPSLQPEKFLIYSKSFPFRLSSAKALAYCHSQHREIKSLNRLMPDPILEISPEVAETRGIEENDWVRVSTKLGSYAAKAKVVKDLAPDSVFGQHGWWHSKSFEESLKNLDNLGVNLNSIVDTSQSDPISGSIPLRFERCNVEKITTLP